ncbi:hypothetical protein [Actinophytocola gossypii]|uniref:Uncharacterized protein n=1 Tax=Actinophytocola gossypii TaxID=2812003 RepID=A0ABT2JCB1_9PSEU|nr:hypothetical protein [Actinophytocola gossypii]MCT2585406.1 hypothetical protein [Actinophytocola gossypii]
MRVEPAAVLGVGWYLPVPYLAVRFGGGWAAGLVLAALLAGVVLGRAVRWRVRGCVLGAAGFAVLGLADALPAVLAGAVAVGAGGALTGAGESRFGALVGPVLGLALVTVGFPVACLVAASGWAVVGGLSLRDRLSPVDAGGLAGDVGGRPSWVDGGARGATAGRPSSADAGGPSSSTGAGGLSSSTGAGGPSSATGDGGRGVLRRLVFAVGGPWALVPVLPLAARHVGGAVVAASLFVAFVVTVVVVRDGVAVWACARWTRHRRRVVGVAVLGVAFVPPALTAATGAEPVPAAIALLLCAALLALGTALVPVGPGVAAVVVLAAGGLAGLGVAVLPWLVLTAAGAGGARLLHRSGIRPSARAACAVCPRTCRP